MFMNIHPHIAGIAKTFRVVGFELINFLLSFGIIFVFLAFLAHIRSPPDANALSPSYLFMPANAPLFSARFSRVLRLASANLDFGGQGRVRKSF